jgi:hypothetical protein
VARFDLKFELPLDALQNAKDLPMASPFAPEREVRQSMRRAEPVSARKVVSSTSVSGT